MAKTLKSLEARASDQRRSWPKVDGAPESPKQIDDMYKKARIAPNLNVDGGDGLVSKQVHDYERGVQRSQALGDNNVDGKLSDYDNDVKDGWLRGSGVRGATARPSFDSVGMPAPARGGGKSTAKHNFDAKTSPFSAAAKTWKED
jgi:hypothetical protein